MLPRSIDWKKYDRLLGTMIVGDGQARDRGVRTDAAARISARGVILPIVYIRQKIFRNFSQYN